MNQSIRSVRVIASLASVATLLVLAGCAESIVRRESISSGFGNSLAANTALQVVDPWPEYLEDTHVHTSDAKASNAIQLYQNPAVKSGASGESTAESNTAVSN